MTRPVKRSFTIRGHRTSISLEAPFWEALKDAAQREGVSLAVSHRQHRREARRGRTFKRRAHLDPALFPADRARDQLRRRQSRLSSQKADQNGDVWNGRHSSLAGLRLRTGREFAPAPSGAALAVAEPFAGQRSGPLVECRKDWSGEGPASAPGAGGGAVASAGASGLGAVVVLAPPQAAGGAGARGGGVAASTALRRSRSWRARV